MVELLIDNIFDVEVAFFIMGTNCVPILAELLFAYSYEVDYMQGLLNKTKNKKHDSLISRFVK
jgi:hypothetical protein